MKKTILNDIKLFVLDLDGTFYIGNKILNGSLEFLSKLKTANKQFVFLTNNSSKSTEDYVVKLNKMGLHITVEDVITSGDVMVHTLNNTYKNKKVFLVGTPALQKNFANHGITLVDEKPDIVVVAYDTTLTYEKLEKACTYIREGALFFATHPDINCPTENGYIPDCGAICKLLEISTGVAPKFVGKPYAETLNYVLHKKNINIDEIAFIGDRIYTDVAAAVNNNAKGFLVLTGETTMEIVNSSNIKPTMIFKNLLKIAELL